MFEGSGERGFWLKEKRMSFKLVSISKIVVGEEKSGKDKNRGRIRNKIYIGRIEIKWKKLDLILGGKKK